MGYTTKKSLLEAIQRGDESDESELSEQLAERHGERVGVDEVIGSDHLPVRGGGAVETDPVGLHVPLNVAEDMFLRPLFPDG